MPRLFWPPNNDLLLAQFHVPSCRGLYSVGCTERHRVTFGSQQIRAINLIHALSIQDLADWRADHVPKRGERWSAYPSWTPKILIVGAGAAGLTAAAYAAYRGASVTIIEKQLELLAHFKGSERLLHPRIYEWGAVQPFRIEAGIDGIITDKYWRDGRVGLPLLDWEPGSADAVRTKLLEEWEYWKSIYDINELTGTGHPPPGQSFDIEILAVGLGLEADANEVLKESGESLPNWLDYRYSGYWDNDGLLDTPGRYLIVGNGDGALNDLFRTCIKGFKQSELPDYVGQWDTEAGRPLELAVGAIEQACGEARESDSALARLADEYLQLDKADNAKKAVARLDNWVRERLRDDVQVELAVRPGKIGPFRNALAGANTFPLNRLVLSSLMRISREEAYVNRPFRVVLNTGNLPVNLAREQLYRGRPYEPRWQLIFRAGAKHPSPLRKELECRNIDPEASKKIVANDQSRQPLWRFSGEQLDGETKIEHLRALYLTHIMRPQPFSDRQADSVFYRTDHFDIHSDAFDSVFQAALYDAVGEHTNVADFFFQGVLRFFTLVYDCVILTDSQVFDGKFFLRRDSTARNISDAERNILRKQVRVRIRPGVTYNILEAFLLKGKQHKPFVSSFCGPSFNEAYSRFIANDKSEYRSSVELLAGFTNYCSEEGSEAAAQRMGDWIGEVREFYASHSYTGESQSGELFTLEPWPDAGRTQFWNDKLQRENPVRFLNGLQSDEGKRAFAGVFAQWGDRSGTHHDLTARRDAEPNHLIRREFDHVRDWYDRAYNRMVTKMQGLNVFGAVYSGTPPGEEPTGGQPFDPSDISILKLGAMGSGAFAKVHRAVWSERKKNPEKISRKPVTEGPWNIAINELDRGPDVPKIDFPESVIESDEHAVSKLKAFSTVQKFRFGWIGDIHGGAYGETCVAGTDTIDPDETLEFRAETEPAK